MSCALSLLAMVLVCSEYADRFTVERHSNVPFRHLVWESADCPDALRLVLPASLESIEAVNCCFEGDWAAPFGASCAVWTAPTVPPPVTWSWSTSTACPTLERLPECS